MNRHLLHTTLSAVALCLTLQTAHADEYGKPAEAEALVGKAVAAIKANGAEKVFDEVTNGKTYKDRDLYVFIYNLEGKAVAHGANPKLVGKDLIDLKDADGKPLIRMLVDLVKTKGKGWTEEVKFRNPVTDKIQTRVNYCERQADFAVCSGVFKY